MHMGVILEMLSKFGEFRNLPHVSAGTNARSRVFLLSCSLTSAGFHMHIAFLTRSHVILAGLSLAVCFPDFLLSLWPLCCLFWLSEYYRNLSLHWLIVTVYLFTMKNQPSQAGLQSFQYFCPAMTLFRTSKTSFCEW